jgi:selenocysteine-specific elongation factor
MSGIPRRAVFATAGHVDHGKTALMRALTGTETDRLPEEKRRGISIELGFAELPGEPVSFIDVPGHRKLVHAMIAGVGGVDALVLCVAADDGVMPQTREHLQVSALLGIRQVIVALTKVDKVDAETLELAESDVRTTLEALGLTVVDVFATSAVTGRGVEELRRGITQLAASLARPEPTALAWLAIDRVFTVKGAGTIVTGTLTRGRLIVGQDVFVHGPGGRRDSTCRSLEVHGRPRDAVVAPTRVAVNLARLETDQVRRGDVLSTDALLPTTRRMDVALIGVGEFSAALPDGSAVVVHLGTDRAAARLHAVERGLAQLVLETPLPCFGGAGFVLRGFSTDPRKGAVVGGGRVLDALPEPLPPRRNKAAREARARVLASLERGEWHDGARGLLELATPRPLGGSDIEHRLGLEPGTASKWFDAHATGVVPLCGGTSFVLEDALDALRRHAVDVVEAHHRKSSHDAGISLETLRIEIASVTSREAADLAIDRAQRLGDLVVSALGSVCTPRFAETRRTETADGKSRLLGVLAAAGLSGVSEGDVTSGTGLTAGVVRSLLAELSAEARARRLTDLWFSESVLDDLRLHVAAHFRNSDELTIAAFKDLAGVGRKQAIPLLEQLDREGTTRRVGDTRRAGARIQK